MIPWSLFLVRLLAFFAFHKYPSISLVLCPSLSRLSIPPSTIYRLILIITTTPSLLIFVVTLHSITFAFSSPSASSFLLALLSFILSFYLFFCIFLSLSLHPSSLLVSPQFLHAQIQSRHQQPPTPTTSTHTSRLCAHTFNP